MRRWRNLRTTTSFWGSGSIFITIMGKPSATDPWGWQLDGHHANHQLFCAGRSGGDDAAFFGSEPVKATSGKYKGVEILQQEQNEGLEMLRGLPEAARRKAVLNFSKTGNNNLTEAFKDNVVLDYAGVRGANLEPAARKRLDGSDAFVCQQHAGRACAREDERGAAAHRQHLVRVDWGGAGGQRVLLPRAESGYFD